jgi:predicted O-linked N-acetylglucosamine transferase (SPINDLY family)
MDGAPRHLQDSGHAASTIDDSDQSTESNAPPVAPSSLNIPEALQVVRYRVEQGALPEAEALCLQVLQIAPDNAVAWHELGGIAHRAGRADLAVEYITRAIIHAWNVPEYHSNLGYVLWEQGNATAAIASCQQALRLQPDYFPAHVNLGLALQAQGDLAGAVASFKEALRLQPSTPWVYCNLGLALHALGDLEGAIAQYREALCLKPDFADAYFHLGTSLQATGDLAGAVAHYQQAVQFQPTYAAAHNNLGTALQEQGNLPGAIVHYQQALRLQPENVHAHNNLGNAWRVLGNVDGAIASFQEVLRLQPRFPGVHNNLALALYAAGDLGGAIAQFQEELRLHPDTAAAVANLLRPLQEAADWAQADALAGHIRHVQNTQPAACFTPFILLTIPSTAAEQLACAQNWVARQLAPMEQLRPSLGFHFAPAAKVKLRLGYLSSDFREHAVAYLIPEIIERHDREQFEVFAYSHGPDDGSAHRQRLIRAFDRFIDMRDLSSVDAARQIYADGVDILLDLNGHTRGSRMEILALRPAPIQVLYLGYPGTSGAPFIDYLITDRFLTPPDQQPYFSETFAYLPDSYQPNDRQRQIAGVTPTRRECGLPEEGVVFCCFNNPYKITPAMFDVWMRLLAQTPSSVLWLITNNDLVIANLRREAQARGVDPERVVFAARRPLAEYQACYRLADLFLDTLPYNAGATASDALWAGLPVLTCAGETCVSRMAGSLLHAMGLPELVTTSLAEYETEVLRLAHTPGVLEALRARLAVQRDSAPLFDSERYTRHLEEVLRTMWHTLVEGATAAGQG